MLSLTSDALPDNFIAARCPECRHRWLLDIEGSFRCPACWFDDGSWPGDPEARRGSKAWRQVVAEAAMAASRSWSWHHLTERES